MDLLGLLSGLGGDPAAMSAVSELLKLLDKGNSGCQARPQGGATEKTQEAEYRQFTAPSPQIAASSNRGVGNSSPCGNGGNLNLSPELLGSLLSAFGGASGGEQKKECCHRENSGCDGCGSIGKLLGGKAESENRLCLLNALRPYLSEERRCKLELILKLLKIAEIGKLSGLLNSV